MASSNSGALRGRSLNEHTLRDAEKVVNTQVGMTGLLTSFHDSQPPENLQDLSYPSTHPLALSIPLDMSPVVAPASTFSSPRDYNRNPYTETAYTPKRFRPEENEDDPPNNAELFRSAPSTSNAWMPPDFTDEPLVQLDSAVSPEKVRQSRFLNSKDLM